MQRRFTTPTLAAILLLLLAGAGPAAGQPAGEEEGSPAEEAGPLAVAAAPLEEIQPAPPTSSPRAIEPPARRVALPAAGDGADGSKSDAAPRSSSPARQAQRRPAASERPRSSAPEQHARANEPPTGLPAPGASPPSTPAPRSPRRATGERATDGRRSGQAGGGFAATRQLYPTDRGRPTAVEEAKAQFRRTGRARTVSTGDSKVFPYGQSQPYVKTTALRHTILELAEGEYVVNSFIGDDTRWQVETGVTGTQQRFTQVVAVKPLDCGVTTNLSLTTNHGRLYQVTLDAAPCDLPEDRNPQEEYASHVRWWYPEGMGRSPAPPAPARRDGPTSSSGSNAPSGTRGPGGPAGASIPVSEANTDYEVDADRGVPCKPSMVADDGERMYVRFPEGPLCENTYPLYRMSEDGELYLMNYTVLGSKEGAHTYVTESVPARAAIQYRTGEGDEEKRVVIENRRLLRKMNRRR